MGSVILLKLAMVTCGVLLLLLLLLAQLATAAAITGSPQSQCQFEVAPRFSALTSERTTELVVRLLQVPQHPAQFVCTAAINATAVIVAAATIRAGDRRLLVPVHGLRSFLPLTNSSASVVRAELRCTLGGGSGAPRPLVLVRHPPHPNEVKVDAWTLGLVADGLPFFPFGAYVEWPTRGAEYEEAEAGLNTFLPTHGTDLNGRSPADRADMLEFMDTAARLGLRVVYQISGVADANNSDPKKWAVLEAEVTAVRRHPALLGWYLADEPDGSGVDPARLSAAYQRVKQLDPYHPVMVSEPTNLATNQLGNQPTNLLTHSERWPWRCMHESSSLPLLPCHCLRRQLQQCIGLTAGAHVLLLPCMCTSDHLHRVPLAAPFNPQVPQRHRYNARRSLSNRQVRPTIQQCLIGELVSMLMRC